LIGDAAKADEAMRRLESFGFENGSLVQPFEGMRSMLEKLHAAGLQLAIWTGRDRQTTEALLTAHNLVTFFTVVVCGDDLPTHKPHPAGLLKILKHLDVQPHEALYSGDADADVLGGAEAGVRTVLIHHGREVETPIRTRAWHVVETPPQAYALIAAVLKTDASTPL
jgi:phosphoglycolate phosphatase/pyrophosphatase PpaX